VVHLSNLYADVLHYFCCTYPSVAAAGWPLQRATKIEVQYQDLDGKAQQMQLRDFVARVFQHEYDHLQVSWELQMQFLCSSQAVHLSTR
jgi:hypothetical protein